MKVIYTSIFFLLSISHAYSQHDYIPMVLEDRYCIHLNYTHTSPIPYLNNAAILYFKGDTMISNKRYVTRYNGTLALTDGCPFNDPPCYSVDFPYNITETSIEGYFREVPEEKRIYVRYEHLEDEIVLYDYLLSVGDTISEHLVDIMKNEYRGSGVIDSISVDFVLGKNRIVQHFRTNALYPPYEEYYAIVVEGYGFPNCNICEGSMEDCNIISATERAIMESKTIYITPNPVNQLLTVNCDCTIAEIIIINQGGEIITRDNSNDIDVSHLPKGLYFTKIKGKNNKYYYSKFMKM